MLFRYLKFVFYVLISLLLYYLGIRFGITMGSDITSFILFPAAFLFMNYAFFKLILGYIKYYNDLIILHNTQLIVIKTSLLLKDDVEIIDLHNVTKLDTYCRGLVPNVLGFGTLVVEQQRDAVREFSYIPDSHRAVKYLKHAKHKMQESSKKSYVVPEMAQGEKCDIIKH